MLNGGSGGRVHRFQKDLTVSLWESDSTVHLIYYLSKLFLTEFMVSVASFKSSSILHGVHVVNLVNSKLVIDPCAFQLQPLIQTESLLAPKVNDGNGHNAKLEA